jgi:FlaA1/EpsC-like NDP-sugar epimerase
MSRRVLIVGAGEAARMVARELRRSPEYGRELVGLLDDNPALHGTRVEDATVLGPTAEVELRARELRADEIILAIPSAPGSVIRALLVQAQRARVPVRIVPGIRDIIKGTVHFEQIREVAPEDLLGRETVDLIEGPIRAAIEGKEVLVTGAGGSIGSELCRLLVSFHPARLYLLGRGENSLFEIEEELRDAHGFHDGRIVLADVRNAERMRLLAGEMRPDVVLHAAAHKHVPLM